MESNSKEARQGTFHGDGRSSSVEDIMETFPGLDRNELYKKVYKYYLIDKYRNRDFVDNDEKVKSLEVALGKGEINIQKGIQDKKVETPYGIDRNNLDFLVKGLNTSSETLTNLFEQLKGKPYSLTSAETGSAQILIESILLNPNFKPDIIEQNLEVILSNFRRAGADRENFGLFLSRPDLTPETIRKIIKLGHLSHNGKCIILYNPNMPEDLKKEILANDSVIQTLKEAKKLGTSKKDFLKLDEEHIQTLEKTYPEKI